MINDVFLDRRLESWNPVSAGDPKAKTLWTLCYLGAYHCWGAFFGRLSYWGLSEDEMVSARSIHVIGGSTDIAEDGEYDVDFEDEADGLLVEHLDSLTVSENYRAISSSVGTVE